MVAINNVTDLTITHGVAVVTLDYPPVNALSPAVLEGMFEAITTALDDSKVAGILLTCDGRTFIAGADLKSLGKVQPKVDFFDLQARIETAAKPTVAALHGTALGGGLEVALTFHYRVAVPSARMGLPEVTLGLLPGGGGTQRLTRIVGAGAALDMLTTGRQVDATEALRLGLVDHLVPEDDLRGGALAYVRELIAAGAAPKRVRDLEGAIQADRDDPGLFDRFRAEHARRLRGLDAPQAIVRCVEAAVCLSFDEGLAVERREFGKLLHGPQSAALRHLFAAERAAQKIPDLAADAPPPALRTIGIVGNGELAAALSKRAAKAGYAVVESDGADLVILAAAPGDWVARLDTTLRPDTLIAITDGLENLDALPNRHPDRLLGLGFARPPHRLLEIVRGAATHPAALATAMQLAKKLGKAAVVTRPTGIASPLATILHRQVQGLAGAHAALMEFGFTEDVGGEDGGVPAADTLKRVLYPVVNEAARLLEQGIAARASDIDLAAVTGLGWPAHQGGPLFHADLIGLATVVAGLEAMGIAPTPLLLKLASAGRTFTGS
ncbi:MAG: enoyl-CoA hydratase-related protein [Azospirillaceae bacterium]|nr:enoyl-CoA hydratase-related protein [Azospirillaceae bacterium]